MKQGIPLPSRIVRRIITLYKEGNDNRAVAKMLDIHPTTALKYRKKYKLPKQPSIVEYYDKELLSLYRSGANDSEIATVLHISGNSVHEWRKRKGFRLLSRGTTHHGKCRICKAPLSWFGNRPKKYCGVRCLSRVTRTKYNKRRRLRIIKERANLPKELNKRCTTCHKIKPIRNFTYSLAHKYGYGPMCKTCFCSYRKKQRHKLRLREPLKIICNNLIKTVRGRAKKLRVKKDRKLTYKYLLETIAKRPYCECCNKKFNLVIGRARPGRGPNPDRPSVDRIDPTGGYTLKNVGIICWRCNDQKRQLNEKLLTQILQYIRYRKRHNHAP